MQKFLKFKFLCPMVSVVLIIFNLVGVIDNFVLINSSPINSYLVYLKNFRFDNIQMIKITIYLIHLVTFVFYGSILDIMISINKVSRKKLHRL